MRIALAHGLHRRSSTHLNLPDFALRNNIRVWWTTYIIERQMEFLMGRPSQIRDEDIDTEPAPHMIGSAPADGLRAHAELAKLMGQIVSQVFRTQRRRKEDADEVLHGLRMWKQNLHPSFGLDDDEFSTSSRSVLLLHLLYNQVCRIVILLTTS